MYLALRIITILQVSTGKHTIRKGSTLFSSEWVPTEQADASKFNKNIIEFCLGLSIRKIERVDQDNVTISKGNELEIHACNNPSHFQTKAAFLFSNTL